ncbi:ATP-binding protein [Streptomyces sp. NPDC088785]|uniref:ATP-binding protein n=1 Tax=Streptomyces sp. NPDC088785 TaxID=3365897 RepID=UPI0037F451A4
MPPARPGPRPQVIALDGDSACISEARAAARRFLEEARDTHRLPVSETIVENTQLIVSELVTNVVKYAPGPGLLHLSIDDTGLSVRVEDSGPAQPLVREADPHRIGQHGLEIVALLARTLTVSSTGTGKQITATLPLTAPAPTP